MNKTDLEFIRDELDNKVGILEFNEQMDQKISKNSIENMFSKKVSKKDLQYQMNNEIKSILEILMKDQNDKTDQVRSSSDDIYVKQTQYNHDLDQLKQKMK